MRPSPAFIALLVLLVLAILVATLMPSLGDTHVPQCLLCGATLVADAILNILLFVPLAAVARLAGWSRSRILVSGALLSATIELAQLFITGRHATPVDVFANVAGVVVGIALVDSSRWWLRPPSERAGWLSLAAALFALAVFVATSALLRPTLPHSTYYGQWTVAQFGMERYGGRVIDATIGSLEIPPHVLADSDSVRALLLAGASLRVRLVVGLPPPGLAPILSIADEQYRRIALLGADREDLIFALRRRASAWRLFAPESRMVGAMADVTPTDTATITVRRVSQGYCLLVNRTSRCRESPTLGMGWAFLRNASGFQPWSKKILRAAWLMALALPVGFWTRRRWLGLTGPLLIACGLLFGPLALAVGSSGLAEYVGAALGLAAGLAIHKYTGRATPVAS